MSQIFKKTALSPSGNSSWTAEICQGWRIGSAVNGGYALSLVGQALAQTLTHPDPLTINAFYLAPCHLGQIEVQVLPLSETKNTSFASADLFQNGQLKLRATAAYIDQNELSGPDWSGADIPEVPSFDEVKNPPMETLEIHNNVDIRMVRGLELFTDGVADGSGEFVAWLAHRDGTDPSVIDLLLFADVMPPPVFSLFGISGWVPTIELTVQVRQAPVLGPVLARHKTRHLIRGIAETDTEIWDQCGELVAIARQTTKVLKQSIVKD